MKRIVHAGRAVVLIALVALVVAGCDIMLMKGWDSYDEYDQTTDSSLFRVVTPSGGETFSVGNRVTISWSGTAQPTEIDMVLFRSGSEVRTIGRVNGAPGSYEWIIPADLDLATEANNEFQIVLRGFHPDYHDSLILEAYSRLFTIAPEDSSGLSDVEVSSRTIDVTLIDDGSEIDNDTIDLYLNGVLIADDYVLVGPPGETFALLLQPGQNTLEVLAVNEGSVSPNTALLTISDVTVGHASQQWRLQSGERGSLTITAP